MSNKAHDHVHRLIHSMSRAEKRYFKLHLQRHAHGGESVSGQLFDAISAMPSYDEAALLERFKGKAFTHRFAITKRRLYEGVLRSLDAFHAERSLESRLARGLHQVRILYDRALYEDAAKLLHGLRRLARQHDRLPVLASVVEWERRLAERDNYAHVGGNALCELNDAVRALRAEQQELDALWELKSHVFTTLYRDGPARDVAMQETVHTLLRHEAMKHPEALLSSKARFLHHHIRSAASFALCDMAACGAHLEANLALLTAEQERFQDEPSLVLSVLGNLAYVCMVQGRHEEAMAHLAAFRRAPAAWNMPETEDLELKLFSTTCSLELGIHLLRGNVSEALALVPVVERGLERHADRLGPIRRAGFALQLAQVHLLAGEVPAALRWANRLLDGLRPDESTDIAIAARLLYLALLHEADKRDLMAYALRNTERFLRTRQRLFPGERHYLQLFRSLLREGGHREAFQDFRAAMLGSDAPAPMNEPFDALSWAESKLTGRSFAELVQERARGQERAA